MKIVWKDFDSPISLDTRKLKHKDNFHKVYELFFRLDSDVNNKDNTAQPDDVALYNDIISLIKEESQEDSNKQYYNTIENAFCLFGLISNRATNGAHFRLEDGRQIGPITNLNMLFEQAGDDAIILSYGVQTEAVPKDSPRRSFAKVAFAKIKEARAAKDIRSVVQVTEHLTQILLNNQEKK